MYPFEHEGGISWANPGMAKGAAIHRHKEILKNFNLNQKSINTFWKLTNEKKIDISNFLSYVYDNLALLNFL